MITHVYLVFNESHLCKYHNNPITNFRKLTSIFKCTKKQRADEKALFLASMVQGTSALEMQGLEDDSLNSIIASYEKEF